jgi:toxin YoeB
VAARTKLYTSQFVEDLAHWRETDPKLCERIERLVEEAAADPFTGIGKPEPLRHQLSGCWSRRINQEHRLVYRVGPDSVTFLQCRKHC